MAMPQCHSKRFCKWFLKPFNDSCPIHNILIFSFFSFWCALTYLCFAHGTWRNLKYIKTKPHQLRQLCCCWSSNLNQILSLDQMERGEGFLSMKAYILLREPLRSDTFGKWVLIHGGSMNRKLHPTGWHIEDETNENTRLILRWILPWNTKLCLSLYKCLSLNHGVDDKRNESLFEKWYMFGKESFGGKMGCLKCINTGSNRVNLNYCQVDLSELSNLWQLDNLHPKSD